MKYRKMIVWSGGNEKAMVTKWNAFLYFICFIMLCIIHIATFICNPYDDRTKEVTIGNHILFGLMVVGMFGWLTVLFLYAAIDSYKEIKKNKLISLYLYDMNNFIKIGKIPDDKFILFSSEYGTVLADKEHEDESRNFSSGARHFSEFEDYYEKHAVSKEEIVV